MIEWLVLGLIIGPIIWLYGRHLEKKQKEYIPPRVYAMLESLLKASLFNPVQEKARPPDDPLSRKGWQK